MEKSRLPLRYTGRALRGLTLARGAALILALSAAFTVSADADYPDGVHLCHANSSMKIALTFDDGPHPTYTAEILDILAEYGIKATFFVIGENARKYPELVRRELAEGHEIGNHTFSHPCKTLPALSYDQLASELLRTENTVFESSEYRVRLFRPPGGITNQTVLSAAKRFDYEIILWNIDTVDWKHTPAPAISSYVTSSVKSGDIILCHDFATPTSNTPAALRLFIPSLLEAGFTFVTVSDLLESE